MNWSDVFSLATVKKVAPFLVGMVNPAAGKLLSIAMACDNTPDAVAAAVQADPAAGDKIMAYQVQLQTVAANQAVADHQADVAQVQAVNQTMQVEDSNKVHWRNVFGYEFGLAFTLTILAVIACAIWLPASMSTLLAALTPLATLFGYAAAILGVTAWHDGAVKRLAAGDTSLSASIGQWLGGKSGAAS